MQWSISQPLSQVQGTSPVLAGREHKRVSLVMLLSSHNLVHELHCSAMPAY